MTALFISSRNNNTLFHESRGVGRIHSMMMRHSSEIDSMWRLWFSLRARLSITCIAVYPRLANIFSVNHQPNRFIYRHDASKCYPKCLFYPCQSVCVSGWRAGTWRRTNVDSIFMNGIWTNLLVSSAHGSAHFATWHRQFGGHEHRRSPNESWSTCASYT